MQFNYCFVLHNDWTFSLEMDFTLVDFFVDGL